MARIVMKFGGTSVADLDRIRNVAGRVKREVEAGHEVAVVVSAMGDSTDRLLVVEELESRVAAERGDQRHQPAREMVPGPLAAA